MKILNWQVKTIIYDYKSLFSVMDTDLPQQHLIDEDAELPPVHAACIAVIYQHLWSQKLWGATEGGGAIAMPHSCSHVYLHFTQAACTITTFCLKKDDKKEIDVAFVIYVLVAHHCSKDFFTPPPFADFFFYLVFFIRKSKKQNFFTFFTQAKICDLHKAFCIHQEIIQLEIPWRHKHANTGHIMLSAPNMPLEMNKRHHQRKSPVDYFVLVEKLQTQQHTWGVKPADRKESMNGSSSQARSFGVQDRPCAHKVWFRLKMWLWMCFIRSPPDE